MATDEEIMTTIASQLEKGFNSKKRQTGFVLVTWPLSQNWTLTTKPVVNFVGNSTQDDIHAAIKNLAESFGYHCFLKAKDLNSIS